MSFRPILAGSIVWGIIAAEISETLGEALLYSILFTVGWIFFCISMRD